MEKIPCSEVDLQLLQILAAGRNDEEGGNSGLARVGRAYISEFEGAQIWQCAHHLPNVIVRQTKTTPTHCGANQIQVELDKPAEQQDGRHKCSINLDRRHPTSPNGGECLVRPTIVRRRGDPTRGSAMRVCPEEREPFERFGGA